MCANTSQKMRSRSIKQPSWQPILDLFSASGWTFNILLYLGPFFVPFFWLFFRPAALLWLIARCVLKRQTKAESKQKKAKVNGEAMKKTEEKL